MSRAYKFHDPEGIYFISYATVGWVDVFTRREYRDIVVDSLRHCQQEKGLRLFEWVVMSNHVHLIVGAANGHNLADIMRDHKKYTAKQIIRAIEEHGGESRREWMLRAFREAGAANSNNTTYQFWRQDNQPLQLDTNEEIDGRVEYIHDNPVAAGLVAEPHEYLYSSACKPGMLKLEEW